LLALRLGGAFFCFVVGAAAYIGHRWGPARTVPPPEAEAAVIWASLATMLAAGLLCLLAALGLFGFRQQFLFPAADCRLVYSLYFGPILLTRYSYLWFTFERVRVRRLLWNFSAGWQFHVSCDGPRGSVVLANCAGKAKAIEVAKAVGEHTGLPVYYAVDLPEGQDV
jgi:hypothetical protein